MSLFLYEETKKGRTVNFLFLKKEAIVGIRFSGVPHVNKIQWSISSEKDFLAKIEEYKTEKAEKPTVEDEISVFEKIINWISNNLIIVIPSTILIVGIIAYIIISFVKQKKKRKRIKI